mgnify:CR=1 FL=1|tara:strand:- start:17177 stop:17350 length:174 start_codon:yes stop_codon:yes gene_type:complete
MFKNYNISDSTKKLLLWKWCISGIEPGRNNEKCDTLYHDYLKTIQNQKKDKDKNKSN